MTGRGKAKASAFRDEGGAFVSMPVVWFNNSGGWKKQFLHPHSTFVVAVVERSHMDTLRHEMCVLGAPPGDNFVINQEVFAEYKALWVVHGRRSLPSYELRPPAGEKYLDLTAIQQRPVRTGVPMLWT